tara:strand:- start:320 stop:445 length:126 start_codon:yes stop_codon:yes gene_type:complete
LIKQTILLYKKYKKDKEIVYEKKEFDKWMENLVKKNGTTKY